MQGSNDTHTHTECIGKETDSQISIYVTNSRIFSVYVMQPILLLWSKSNGIFKLIQWNETYKLDDENNIIQTISDVDLSDRHWMDVNQICTEL